MILRSMTPFFRILKQNNFDQHYFRDLTFRIHCELCHIKPSLAKKVFEKKNRNW